MTGQSFGVALAILDQVQVLTFEVGITQGLVQFVSVSRARNSRSSFTVQLFDMKALDLRDLISMAKITTYAC